MIMTKRIYFAGGCFWGTEHLFKQVRGVVSTKVGYANSSLAAPSYEQVCSGVTRAAETVCVEYDAQVVSLKLLVELFFRSIDPLSLNRQGGDVGTQYRTGIYFVDNDDEELLLSIYERVERSYGEPLAVELQHLDNFFAAEEYHQAYLDKNPAGYCHLTPDLFIVARNINAE